LNCLHETLMSAKSSSMEPDTLPAPKKKKRYLASQKKREGKKGFLRAGPPQIQILEFRTLVHFSSIFQAASGVGVTRAFSIGLT